jgi:hypothetical protein
MASASERSRTFAAVRSTTPFAVISLGRANAAERERTLNLAILATQSGAERGANGGMAEASIDRWGSSTVRAPAVDSA